MKKRSKHVRGPWKHGFSDGSGPAHIVTKVDGQETSVAKLRWGCGCCEVRADSMNDLKPHEKEIAQLITAAPELYKALHDLMKWWTHTPALGETEFEDMPVKIFDAAQAALSKAVQS